MLNPVHLRTLQEVVRQGSFVGAANRLGYTPSAVSQQMAALEREAEVLLFDRSARSARPNAAAVVMARHATGVLTALDSMTSAAAQAREPRTTVHMSSFSSLARELIPLLHADPALRDADVELNVAVHDPSLAVHELRSGADKDISLVYEMRGRRLWWPGHYEPIPLASERYVVLVPESWRPEEGRAAPVEWLTDRPWILHHPISSDADLVRDLFSSAGLRARAVGRSDDYPTTLDLVAAGLGAAFVPALVARTLPAGAARLVVDELPMRRDIFALVPARAPEPSLEMLLDAIRRSLPQLGYEPPAVADVSP